MTRCPTCASPRTVVMIGSDGRAFCAICGTRWMQRGAEQTEVVSRPTLQPPRERARPA